MQYPTRFVMSSLAPALLLATGCGGAPDPQPAATSQPAEAAPAAESSRGAEPAPPATPAYPPASADGYGDVRFVGAATGVQLVRGDQTRLLAETATPTAILPFGGRLVVASADGLHWANLKTGEVSELAAVGHVVDATLDHSGYVLASLVDGRLIRVSPEGEQQALDASAGAGVRFDEATRTLHVTRGDTEHAIEYLPLIGEDAAVWAARDARPMKPFELNGITLTGGEYWPSRGDAPPKYPDDVLWGFYPEKGVVFEGSAAPESATPAAVACAEQSFAALRAFMERNPPEFHEAAKSPEVSSRFYLWVNDYTEASDPFPTPLRPAKLWYWQRKPAVEGRIPGYWKWETTITQSGECQIPQREQIDAYLKEKASPEPSPAPQAAR
jgi:hypothetical protein